MKTAPAWTLAACDCPYDGFTRLDPVEVLCQRCKGTSMRPVHASLLDMLAGDALFETKAQAIEFAIEAY